MSETLPAPFCLKCRAVTVYRHTINQVGDPAKVYLFECTACAWTDFYRVASGKWASWP